MLSISFFIVFISFKKGTLLRIQSSVERIADVIIGSAEFFAPLISTSPSSLFPPVINILSTCHLFYSLSSLLCLKGINHLIQIPLHYSFQPVEGKTDPVVCDPVLRKVIRPDLLT